MEECGPVEIKNKSKNRKSGPRQFESRVSFYYIIEVTLITFWSYTSAIEREAMPRTPAERVDLSFTLRLPPDDMKFLEERRKELEANANAEALRDVIRNLRTCFGLPAFMVDRLERDRKERGLSLMDYLKELLAMRYQELPREPVSRTSSSEKLPKR